MGDPERMNAHECGLPRPLLTLRWGERSIQRGRVHFTIVHSRRSTRLPPSLPAHFLQPRVMGANPRHPPSSCCRACIPLGSRRPEELAACVRGGGCRFRLTYAPGPELLHFSGPKTPLWYGNRQSRLRLPYFSHQGQVAFGESEISSTSPQPGPPNHSLAPHLP